MDIPTLTSYFLRYGDAAIFVIVLLEYMNLPGFPAGVIMPLSGVMAARGNIGFARVMIVTVAAGLAGSLILYALGWVGGGRILERYMERHPEKREPLEKKLDWIRQRGCIGVFAAKLLPAVRTIVSIPAGILRMNLIQYTISSALGIIVWNLIFVGAGYACGEQVFALLGRMQP